MTKFKNFFLALLHFVLIILAWTSPITLSWKIICLGILIYWLQIWTLKGCILSYAQFGHTQKRSEQESFYYHYLTKLGLKLDKAKVNFIVDYIIPPIILAVALVIQLYFKLTPLIHF